MFRLRADKEVHGCPVFWNKCCRNSSTLCATQAPSSSDGGDGVHRTRLATHATARMAQFKRLTESIHVESLQHHCDSNFRSTVGFRESLTKQVSGSVIKTCALNILCLVLPVPDCACCSHCSCVERMFCGSVERTCSISAALVLLGVCSAQWPRSLQLASSAKLIPTSCVSIPFECWCVLSAARSSLKSGRRHGAESQLRAPGCTDGLRSNGAPLVVKGPTSALHFKHCLIT